MTTLPGSLPDLLTRGCPVFWRDEETPFVVTTSYTDADDAMWVVAAPCAGIPLGVQDDPSNFALDLTDPAGMDRAARYLAERVGLVCGATAPEWRRLSPGRWHLCTQRRQGRVRSVTFCGSPSDNLDRDAAGEIAVPGITAHLTDPAAALALAVLACAR